MLKFEVRQKLTRYMKVGEEYQEVNFNNDFEVNNWDDLTNLLSTLIDFGTGTMRFEITKTEVE